MIQYDKTEINSLAILFTEDPSKENSDNLLKVLEPLVKKILIRYPDYFYIFDDNLQDILFKLWDKYLSEPAKLKKIFKNNIPADYFFMKIKGCFYNVVSASPLCDKSEGYKIIPIDDLPYSIRKYFRDGMYEKEDFLNE